MAQYEESGLMQAHQKNIGYAENPVTPMRDGSMESRLSILRSAIDEAYDEFDRLSKALNAISNPMPAAIRDAQTSPSIPGSEFGVALQTQVNRIGDLCDKLRHQRNALDLT